MLCEVASGAQDVLERVGRVGIVDEDGERLALVHGLEPPRHAAELFHAARDRVVLDPEQAGRRDRAEHVLDVEAAAQPRLELEPSGGEARSARAEVEPFGLKIRVVGETEGHQPVVTLQLLREPPSVRVADVHRGGRALLGEEPPLGVEVALDRAVEVEVVLGQVREDERREAHAVEPAELRAVRGRLHRAAAVTAVEHLAEAALEVDRLRRRPEGRTALAADPALDRAEQAGPPAARGEDRVEQERGRGLPVRAR